MNWTELETLDDAVARDDPGAVTLLVEAASCAAGWLVEPATNAGELSLLNAAQRLSHATNLYRQGDLALEVQLEAPDASAGLLSLCRQVDALVVAARDRLLDTHDGPSAEDEVAASRVALLLDAAHRDIAEVLR